MAQVRVLVTQNANGLSKIERPLLSTQIRKLSPLLRPPADPAHAGPDTAHNVAPTERHPVSSPAALRHNGRTVHTCQLQYVPELHRSNLTIAGRYQTSRQAALWYRHLPPYPQDPEWLLRRVRDCIILPVGPAPRGFPA